MNIFILNTGRCGSTTFIKACQHISNYSAGHESRSDRLGSERLAYPDNHIEADNRLAWLLGRLDEKYGDDALYVHLSREREATAASFARRGDFGIMKAYREGILLSLAETPPDYPDDALAHDYIETVEANIALFLKDKRNTLPFHLETAQEDFKIFWERIGAEGDRQAALAEWQQRHNASF